MALAAPYDILELRDRGELVTRITKVDTGPVPITPRDGRPPKLVTAVRLFVPPADKQTEPPWWDVTAQTVAFTLVPLATQAAATGRYVRLTKYGTGPGSRFSVELLPADYTGGPKADTLNQAGP